MFLSFSGSTTYAKQNEIKEIVDSFNDLVNTLEHTITDAKTSSNENASVSHELSTTSMQIGRNAEQSSSIVENTIHEIDTINIIVQTIINSSDQMNRNAKNIQRLSTVSSTVESTIVGTTKVMHNSIASVTQSAQNSLKIAHDTDKIVEMVSNINTLTSQNARSVEEIAAAADHLSRLSESLNQKLNQFQ